MVKPKEGDLFARACVFGRTVEIYYGSYEDFERNSIYNDPVPIYPDLKLCPVFTDGGERIVTEMQLACEKYSGRPDEDRCGRCSNFRRGELLFGLCTACENNEK